jgi:VWFA-related protein
MKDENLIPVDECRWRRTCYVLDQTGGGRMRSKTPALPVIGILLAVSLPAQTVREKVSVDLVSVRVTARDTLGHPVDNLKASDFQLTVDGKIVPIDSLSGPLNLVVDEPNGGKTAEAPPPSQAAAPAAPRRSSGEPLVRTFIFVDETSSNPFDRKDVCEGIAKYVQMAAGPGNEFLVARFDGKLYKLTDWSSDGAAVAQALRRVANRGQMEHVPGPSTLGANTGPDAYFSAAWIPLYSDLVQRALMECLTTLPQTGGRGRLLLVTNGTTVVSPDELALGTNPDLLTSDPTLSPRYGQSSGMTFAVHNFENSPSFQRWSRAVNPGRDILTTVDVLAKAVEYGVEFIPVYTEAVDRGDFDMSGMMAPLGHDPGQTGMTVPTAGDGRLSPHLVTAAALENIAAQTGAEAVGNGRNVAARMSQIDARASYVLTFRDPTPDHDYHTITLKSLRSGLKIVYRRSYRIPDESEQKLDAVVAGFLTPARPDALMGARIDQSPATDSKNRPATRLDLGYAPPLETGAADGRPVQLIAIGRDSDGNLTEPIEWGGTAQRAGDDARFDVSVMFDVAPKYAWSIAVTDQPTGLTSYVFVPAPAKP